MKLNTIFFNPWFAVAGTIGTLAGLFLSTYFFLQGQARRSLTFYRYSSSAVVVKAGQASNMSVSFDGKPVAGDITAVQFALWNSGNQSIRAENILEPVRVSSSGGVRILEARVRFVSRSVTGFDLEQNEIKNGRLGFKWKILEPNDGAVIQLVFGGPPSTQFRVEGTVESQGRVRDNTRPIETPQQQQFLSPAQASCIGIVILVAGIIVAFLPLPKPKEDARAYPRFDRSVRVFVGIFTFGAGVYFLILVSRMPPFEVPI